jgi:hypothetical protein
MSKDTESKNKSQKPISADPVMSAIGSMKNRGFRQSSGGLNPTGASCIITSEKGIDQLIGKCHRAVFYAKKGYEKTNPPDNLTQIKFLVGNEIENGFQRHWQRQGILLEPNVRLRGNINPPDSPDGEMFVSGEIDALLRDHDCDSEGKVTNIRHDRAILLEMKTSRGHFAAKQVIGRGNKIYPAGQPKYDHVMQTAMYMHMRKKLEDHYEVEIPYAIIVYALVDGGQTNWFRIELSEGYEGDIIIYDKYGNLVEPLTTGDMKLAGDDLKPIGGLTIANIRARYQECQNKLEEDEPPDRDFDLRYSDVKATQYFENDLLSKTQYGKHQKDEKAWIGDWQCRYCDFRQECYPFDLLTDAVEDGLLTPKQALSDLGFDSTHGGSSN